MLNKKGIGPVVATSLLIVVAVVSLVGFQSWFNTYSSEMYLDVESQSSDSISASGIEAVVGESLYFKNGFGKNISIFSVSIDGYDCNVSGNKTSGMKDLNISLCINNVTSATPEVVVITDKGIFSEKVYLKSGSSSSYGSTGLCDGLVGGDWVEIQGNQDLGTSDFCVMKYEAKNVGGNATSQAIGDPWGSITQPNAIIKCQNLGANYDLINLSQWTTIAREIENISSNWNSGTIGVGTLSRGYAAHTVYGDAWTNSDFPVSTDSSCLYNNGTNDCSSTGIHLYKRTFDLLSGDVIWDFSGNTFEFNKDTCTQGTGIGNWDSSGDIEWTHANLVDYEKNFAGPNGPYSSSEGVGLYEGCGVNGNVFLRGGAFNMFSAIAGIYAIDSSRDINYLSLNSGFRCVYTP